MIRYPDTHLKFNQKGYFYLDTNINVYTLHDKTNKQSINALNKQ